jgi:acyl-CoA thioesterase-1
MVQYIALGDSITFGENATRPKYTYPHRFVALLNSHRGTGAANSRVLGHTIAHPGWTSGMLRRAVWTAASSELASAQLITIWVGGDDLGDAAIAVSKGAPAVTIQRSIQTYGTQLYALVRSIRSVSRARIILCTQYNPFPNTPLAQTAVSALNQMTAGVAYKTGNLLAPTHVWFEGRQSQLISGYQTGRIQDALRSPTLPIHPNDKGHFVIAQGLYQMAAPLV